MRKVDLTSSSGEQYLGRVSSQPPPPPARSPSLSERLQAVTEGLAAAHTQDEVLQLILTPALQALDALAGAVLLLDHTGARLERTATQGYETQAQPLWQAGPLEENLPARDALHRHESLFFENQGDLVRAYPDLEARTGGVAAVATAVLPMFLDDAPLGVIILDFKEPHAFTPEEQRFLQTLAAQCAIALSRARLMTELQQQVQQRTQQLLTDARAQDAFIAFTEAVGTQTDVVALAQQAVEVLRTRFPDGKVSYFEYDPTAARWQAQAWSDNHSELQVTMIRSGFPSETPMFADVLQTRQPVFRDGWDAGQEQIEHTEEFAQGATYPLLVNGEVRGILGMAARDQTRWKSADRALVQALGRSLTLALARAEQAQRLELQNAELEARTLALERFAQLARSPETDALTLIRQTQQAVTELIGEGFAVYYELDGQRWQLRSQVGQPRDETIQASLASALPYETVLNFRIPWEQGEPFYQDAYDPALDHGVPGTERLASTAALPVWVETRRQGIFGYGLEVSRPWTRADRATLETAVNSLGLLLERAGQTERLAAQNAELAARTRALEAFAHLTQDLATQGDPYEFVRRAQEVTLSLLTPGYALYYERDGGHWRNRVQIGDVGNADLQAFIDAGPLVGQTPSVDVPWATQQPCYQDDYARGSDTPAELVQHVTTVASLPVFRHGAVVGVFIAVLFDARRWTPTDKAVLETVVGSLGLALERAEQAEELQRRTGQLERSNKELEQFAYIASHDLQAPIRAVTSFAGMIGKRYGEGLDERGHLYLRQIMDGGEHMKRLVDDLLTFSRVHTEQRPWVAVDAQMVFDAVVRRLQAEAPDAQIKGTALPVVQADPPQVDQVFQNLISNGLKYQREGVSPQVEVSAERDGSMWRFAVSDNGIGIEPQYFERIFEIFQRLHGRETYQGTGIGLAVCKKIVERHGGRLWLESTLGQGTTFFFTLPALQP